jgi:hypothetical protein
MFAVNAVNALLVPGGRPRQRGTLNMILIVQYMDIVKNGFNPITC